MFDLSYMVGELRTLVVLVAIFFSISSQSALNPAPHLPALSPSLGRIKTVGVAGSGAVWPGWCW